MYFIKRLYNPEIFQGRYKRKNYFEGWYYKLIDEPRQEVIAIIPGLAIGSSPSDGHSFVQVINSTRGSVHYFEYPLSAFYAAKDRLYIRIGDNEFSRGGIKLQLNNQETAIQGEIDFFDIVPFPKRLLAPGIMGPYSFVPWMECYHGVVNIHHKLKGNIVVAGDDVPFDGGEGYIEKDWGRSFPEAWIWIQANHFDDKDTSFMFSIAKIPWFKRAFIGFISFLKIGDRFYILATYNNSKVSKIELKDKLVQGIIDNPEYTLYFEATYQPGSMLKAPKNGIMERQVEESISSHVKLLMYDRKGNVIFEGSSPHAGMEISEKAEILLG